MDTATSGVWSEDAAGSELLLDSSSSDSDSGILIVDL